jgi:Undecaprenyl-phosphate galactose phosphotransferase WbaP
VGGFPARITVNEAKMPGLDAFSSLQREVSLRETRMGDDYLVPSVMLAPPGAQWHEGLQPCLKRAMDVIGAGLLLVILAPFMLAIALFIRTDGGPALFGHRRVGRQGRVFPCLKFRSMVTDSQARLDALLASDPAARAEWEATHKLKNDPRVTRIGRFLRATSLDELPQLINVLLGEMSLVGPRPVLQTELDRYYGAATAHYMSVRPGMTGLWQVSGRSDTSYAQRVALDVAYVARPSFWQDVSILLRTPIAVLSRRGAC